MRFLLDTHIWLWSLLEPAKLAGEVIESLENPESELWLSPISVWELLVLHQKGRVRLKDPVEEWVARAFDHAPLREAPLTFEIALETNRIRLPHKDPADRFLAATARVFDLTLVTADERLFELRDISLLANH